MKISSSSSILFATLAFSSSSSLAAPAGDTLASDSVSGVSDIASSTGSRRMSMSAPAFDSETADSQSLAHNKRDLVSDLESLLCGLPVVGSLVCPNGKELVLNSDAIQELEKELVVASDNICKEDPARCPQPRDTGDDPSASDTSTVAGMGPTSTSVFVTLPLPSSTPVIPANPPNTPVQKDASPLPPVTPPVPSLPNAPVDPGADVPVSSPSVLPSAAPSDLPDPSALTPIPAPKTPDMVPRVSEDDADPSCDDSEMGEGVALED